MTQGSPARSDKEASFDTSTDQRFFEYYAEQSQSEASLGRFQRLVDLILKVLQRDGRSGPFDVADIGGGAGTLSRIFARDGHRVTCVDLSRDLLALGASRAAEEGLDIEFINCSATDLPLTDRSVDICVIPELLEHVRDWRSVVSEAARVVRPGGLLFLSTTNTLCPFQDEFDLPLYSWYPPALKRHYEKLSVTTRPELANYSKYPAVNWFTFYSLRDALRQRGFARFFDRVDMIDVRLGEGWKAGVARICTRIPGGRAAVQMATPNSLILAVKGGG